MRLTKRPFAVVFAVLAMVASTLIFTAVPASAEPILIPDTGGYDQIDQGNGAQQDIAGVAFDGNTFSFAWDETDLSGANSSDACTYFQDPDGSVTAICYSVQFNDDGSVADGFPEYTVYDCGDTYGNGKCTGNNPTSTEYEVTCTDPVLVDPYFAEDPDQDLQASCTLTGINGNDAADLLYINTCTKPSASPSSLSNDCIFDPDAPDPGFLKLEKVVADGDAVPADFTLTATNGSETVTGAGSTELATVPTGEYTLTESSALIDDGTYQLVSISCVTDDGAPVDETDGTVVVEPLSVTVCTYTNEVAFVPNPVLSVDKVLTGNADEDGSGDVSLDDTLSYTITATNDGNVELTNVVVTDSLTGDSIICDTVAIGETCVLNVTYMVTLDDVAAGQIDNTGTADSNETDPVNDTETVPVANNPALNVVKTLTGHDDPDGDGLVEAGDILTYTITATNTGDIALTNVTVSDDLTGDDTSCATVAVGDTCVLVVNYAVDLDDVAAGEVVNTATANSDETGPDTDDEIVPVSPNPGLGVNKALTGHDDADGDGLVELGDTLTYTITAFNIGDIALTNVTVSDDLTGDSTTCAIVPTADVPGGDCVLVVTYVVTAADVEAGSVLNTATADSDQTGPETDDETVPVANNPALGVDKALTGNADEDGSGTVSLNDTLSFTITATNTGDITLNNVVVSDDLTGDSTSCATVAPGATCVLEVTYVVTQADVDAGSITNTGVADSDETPEVTDPEVVPVPQDPSIAVDKVFTDYVDNDGSGDVSLGDTLNYTITATNTGNTTLQMTVVDDLTGDSTACTDVAPGGTCVLNTSYIVDLDDVAAGEVVNTATADSDQTGPEDDTETVPVAQNPALGIDKALTGNADEDGNGEVSLNDTLTFTITASNDGDVPLTNVVVSDDLTGDSTTCDTVAVGDDCVLVVTYVVTQADVDAGSITNTGVADSNETDPEEDPEVVPVPQNPLVDLDKTGSLDLGDDGIATPGDVITYTFTVINTGNVTLNSVTIDDPGVSGVTCGATTLAPGESTTCSGTYTIDQADIDAGVYNNTADVNTDEGATDTDSHSEPVPQVPGIGVDKALTGNDDADGSGDVSLGDTLTFTITATNTGNTTLQIDVSDSLTGDATSCADVAPGGECELVVTYTVDQADVDAGSITNTGVADSDQTDPEEDDEVVDVPQLADIDLVKSGSLDDGGDGVANVGDTINYTFDVTNTGNVSLTNVVVTDALLGGEVCTIASLAPGETAQCSGSYDLTQSDIDAGERPNVAEAEGTPPEGVTDDEVVGDSDGDGNPDDPGDNVIDIPEAPAIDVTKSGSLDLGADGVANPGDVVTYTLTVTNTGNVTLSNVSINDPLLGGVVCSFDSLAVGATETCTGTYNLTQADIDAGERDNTATASGTSPQGTDVDDSADAEVDVPQIISLDINKLTNGSDSNTILAGSAVSWTYEVTNTGNTTLTGLSVSDDQGVSVSCPVAELAPGESTTCTGSGTATSGDYTNTGTADADGPQGQDATDSDDSGYFGADPSFTVDKVTTTSTGTGDGEYAVAGDAVTWTYTVTNTGNVDLTDIAVNDSVEGPVCTVGSLAVGESTTCTLDGTAIEGGYTNTGTGDGTYTDDLGNETDLSDSDDSGYTGIGKGQPSIQFTERSLVVTETANGFDATVEVTNQSDGLEADTVVITDFRVILSTTGKNGGPIDPDSYSCTVDGQDTGDLADPIVFGESTTLDISCVTADGEPLKGRYKITLEAEILNRDNTFSTSTTVRF